MPREFSFIIREILVFFVAIVVLLLAQATVHASSNQFQGPKNKLLDVNASQHKKSTKSTQNYNYTNQTNQLDKKNSRNKSNSSSRKIKTSNNIPLAGFISSKSYLVYDVSEKKPYAMKDPLSIYSIASLTKLMTAMVVLDSGQSLDDEIEITEDDVDRIKNSSSRLEVGAVLTRRELLQLSLMSSENRATSALARTYPGGKSAFVKAMNQKARIIGMTNTQFVEPTGLSPQNTSTAMDLLKLVQEASKYPLIRHYSTMQEKTFKVNGKILHYRNSNYLVREGGWDINLSKTGYIQESGKCLVMHVTLKSRPVIFILLGSSSAETRINDAKKLREVYIAKNTGKV